MLKQLPNFLTYSRIIAIPAIAICLYIGGEFWQWGALFIYSVSCVTDFLDGWLARKWNMQSALGRMLDPIADKLLVATILVMLVDNQVISGLNVTAAVIILCREILVSGLREYLAATSVSMPVTQMAKVKTTLQLVSLGFLLIGDTGNSVLPGCVTIGLTLLWVSALLTVYTGYDYLKSGIASALQEDSGKN